MIWKLMKLKKLLKNLTLKIWTPKLLLPSKKLLKTSNKKTKETPKKT